jgi:hypothetical protein
MVMYRLDEVTQTPPSDVDEEELEVIDEEEDEKFENGIERG